MVGQAVYQLGVMCTLIFWGPALLGVQEHASGAPSEHYTIVFNSFVLMQASRGAGCTWVLGARGCWVGCRVWVPRGVVG